MQVILKHDKLKVKNNGTQLLSSTLDGADLNESANIDTLSVTFDTC